MQLNFESILKILTLISFIIGILQYTITTIVRLIQEYLSGHEIAATA